MIEPSSMVNASFLAAQQCLQAGCWNIGLTPPEVAFAHQMAFMVLAGALFGLFSHVPGIPSAVKGFLIALATTLVVCGGLGILAAL